MIKKLDLDIESIVKQSFLEAKKKHGLIKEQEQADIKRPDAFSEEFDVEKHLSYMRLDPKEMGKKGTFESADVDAVIGALVGNQTPGLQRFKSCLAEINKVLGKRVGEFGLPAAQQAEGSSAFSIFSALQLNYLISAIINKQDARVAGKMFEGLVARMVGATASNVDDSIEDMIVDGGKLVSLKTIDPTKSEFKGSKYNLAKAIADKGEVTYLVCEKDKRNDPFSFKAYSFSVNVDNFFNFLSGKSAGESLTIEEIQSMIDGMVVPKNVQLQEELKFLSEGVSPEQELFNFAIMKYAVDKLNAPEEAFQENAPEGIKKETFLKIREFLKKIFNDTFESESYKKFSADEKIKNNLLVGIEKIKDSIPASLGKKILNRNEFESALISVRSLASASNRIKFLFSDYAQKNNIRSPEIAFQSLIQTLQPLLFVLEDIEKTYNMTSQIRKKAAVQAGEKYATSYRSSENAVKTKITSFFSDLKRDLYQQKVSDSDSKTKTQFKLGAETVKKIAVSVGANFDEDYEIFIVSSGMIMTNAAKNNEALKKWIEPIYKQFYSLDTNLKKFYVKDEPGALAEAEKSTEALKIEIQKVPKAETGEYVSAKELKENKNKPLTKDWSVLMLEELLK